MWMKKTGDEDTVYTFGSYNHFIIIQNNAELSNLAPFIYFLLTASFLQQRIVLINAQERKGSKQPVLLASMYLSWRHKLIVAPLNILQPILYQVLTFFRYIYLKNKLVNKYKENKTGMGWVAKVPEFKTF